MASEILTSTQPATGQVESVNEYEIVFSVPAEARRHFNKGVHITLDGSAIATISLEYFQTGRYSRNGEEKLEFRFQLPRPVPGRGRRPRVGIARVSDGQQFAGGEILAKAVGRKPRVLVLIPAGARWKHNSVELYKQSWEKLVKQYFNVGDMMVYDSTLKILDYEDLNVARIDVVTEDQVKRYNADCDYCFLRGSNYINEGMQWEATRSLIERLHLPIYAIGVGAQAEAARKLCLSQDSIAIWKMISERCGSIGVRGTFTAETLDGIGIHNVDVIGCPSLFRTGRRETSLALKPVRDIEHVAFSLRREVDSVYSANPQRYLELQRQAMLRLDRECRKLTVTVHGEPEEKAFFFRDLQAMTSAVEYLQKTGWLTSETQEQVLKIYHQQLYMPTRADDYDRFISTVDLALGYRVHGVLPALANGTPGALVKYDVRSEELARTHNIPLISEEDVGERSWRELYERLDFDNFQREYVKGYDQLLSFLNRNGVPNLL